MSQALLNFLKRRYSLDSLAEPAVARLLKAWQDGHTAISVNAAEVKALKSVSALVAEHGLLRGFDHAKAEREVATRIMALAQAEASDANPKAGAKKPGIGAGLIKKLLGGAGADLAQARAIQVGFERQLLILTGGPGMGKTYTVARLLALLLEQDPALRFALSAPTGKAAQRLGESVAKAADDKALRATLPQAAKILGQASTRSFTLHRLLEWRPWEDRCARNADHPLDLDLLIVDEASMLDLKLWRALLRALPASCRLIVLGDPYQLESVEAGRVLGDMVDAARKDAKSALAASWVQLETNYRFRERPAIGRLANAALAYQRAASSAGLDAKVLDDELLAAAPVATKRATASVGSDGEVTRWAADARGLAIDQALNQVWPGILSLAKARDEQEVLAALESVRLLCAMNEGRFGVSGLNHCVEARLASEGLGVWAQPILIRVNDPASGLFNGDLGALLPPRPAPDAASTAIGARAVFAGPQGPRVFPISQLPHYELAWASTTHRSQGSEYANVLLVLPPDPHPLIGPELIYTAITRAKERVLLVASDQALTHGCKIRQLRVTGLGLELLLAFKNHLLTPP